jgi:transposase
LIWQEELLALKSALQVDGTVENMTMMGKSQRSQPKLFYNEFSLESRLPQEHILRKVKRLVNFDFVRSQVTNMYGANGNMSVDPAVILKLMFLLFFEDIKSERVLMEQLPLRMDWLWFCGYDIDDQTPNHSVISKARRRWGMDVFAEFFANILKQCIDASLVDGTTVHIDSSMIDGNVSKDSLKPQLRVLGRRLYDQLEAQSQATPLEQRVSQTDPDARLGRKNGRTTLGYKDHRVIDDKNGIVTATITTAANIHDGKVLAEAIEEHQVNTGVKVDTAVADKAYGNSENYKYLKEHDITPCIPHQKHVCKQDSDFAHDKFIYEPHSDCYICPGGQQLHRYDRGRPYKNNAYRYRAKRAVCIQCRFFEKCVFSHRSGRQIRRNLDAEYVVWADGSVSDARRRQLMSRRRTKAEGAFADAANNHGFKHARWRGLLKMTIQNLMIATVQNLRKLMRQLVRNTAGNAFAATKTWFAESCLSADSIMSRCSGILQPSICAGENKRDILNPLSIWATRPRVS